MPDPHCAIRFTDPNHTVEAHVVRDKFGSPEDVLSNLARLKRTALPTTNSGSLAAQFVVVDSLVLAYQERSLRNVIASVEQVCQDKSDSMVGELLARHSIENIPNPDTPIWCYEVEVGSNQGSWSIRISDPPDSMADTVTQLFDDVSWAYEGTLTDALDRL